MSPGRAIVAVALLVAAGSAFAVAPAEGRPARRVQRVFFSTVPAVEGLTLRFPGPRTRFVRTDARGRASIGLSVVLRPGRNHDVYRRLRSGYHYRQPEVRTLERRDGSIVRYDRFYGDSVIALTRSYPFTPRFLGQGGRPVRSGVIQSYTLKSRTGELVTVKGSSPVRLQGSRVTGALASRDVEWALQRVMVDGTNVVTRGRYRFHPRRLRGPSEVALLFFSAHITSTDALVGSAMGRSVTLTYPSGRRRRVRLAKDGTATLSGLPRGSFKIKADAPGISPERPLALSRDQAVELKVISHLDIAVAAALLGAVAIVLLVVRRPHLRRLPRRRRDDVAEPPEIEGVAT